MGSIGVRCNVQVNWISMQQHKLLVQTLPTTTSLHGDTIDDQTLRIEPSELTPQTHQPQSTSTVFFSSWLFHFLTVTFPLSIFLNQFTHLETDSNMTEQTARSTHTNALNTAHFGPIRLRNAPDHKLKLRLGDGHFVNNLFFHFLI